jgi:hypothetical protein
MGMQAALPMAPAGAGSSLVGAGAAAAALSHGGAVVTAALAAVPGVPGMHALSAPIQCSVGAPVMAWN